jgi:hypothetical protein
MFNSSARIIWKNSSNEVSNNSTLVFDTPKKLTLKKLKNLEFNSGTNQPGLTSYH